MILDRYLLKQFAPIFLVSLSLFVLLLSLIDLFANLWRYLNYEVPLSQMLLVSLYYLPKSLSYSLPISLLFAAAYTLGDLFAWNELTSVFASGIPFWRFILPLLFLGVAASVFSFFFNDLLVIPTYKKKNDLSRLLLHQQLTESNSDIVIKARNGRLIYAVDYYDRDSNTLNGISVIEQSDDGEFLALIRAPQASWSGEQWEFTNPLVYSWEGTILRVGPLTESREYREHPDTFRRSALDVEDLPVRDAAFMVEDLRNAGLPFIGAQAEYYRRYSFAAASFVVMILSISMGGRFKKNILLMSLLTSLVSAVVFYVMEMITMMMARLGYIPTVAGAWFPILFFTLVGLIALRGAKT